MKAPTGLGKTILAKRIVTQSRFKLAVYLPMNKHSLETDLIEAIFQESVPREEHSAENKLSLAEFLHREQENVCLVLDGYDECRNDPNTRHEGVSVGDVVFRRAYIRTCLVVTTRPHRLAELQNIETATCTKVVEITGFSEESSRLYVSKHKRFRKADSSCTDEPSLGSLDIVDVLDRRGMAENTKHPLMLMMICVLLPDSDMSAHDLDALSETVLHGSFIYTLFQRAWDKKKSCMKGISKPKLEDFTTALLLILGEIAWICLQKRQYSIEKNDFTQKLTEVLQTLDDGSLIKCLNISAEDIVETVVESGLMVERKRVKGIHVLWELEFFHTSGLEYIASLYLSDRVNKNPDNYLLLFLDELKSLPSILDLAKVIEFSMATLKTDLSARVFDHFLVVCTANAKHGNIDGLAYFHKLVRIRKSGVACQKLPEWDGYMRQLGTLQFNCLRANEELLRALEPVYIIHSTTYRAHNEGLILLMYTKLWQSKQRYTPEGYEVFAQASGNLEPLTDTYRVDKCLKTKQPEDWVHECSESVNDPTCTNAQILGDGNTSAVKLCSALPVRIECLCLHYCKWDKEDARQMGVKFQKLLLRLVVFSGCQMNSEAFRIISSSLKTLKMTHIYIGFCSINRTSLAYLIEILHSDKIRASLEEFYFYCPQPFFQLTEEEFDSLCLALTQCCSLNNTGLHTLKLGPWAVPSLTHMIRNRETLRTLRVQRNCLGDDIFHVVRQLSSEFKTLQMDQNGISKPIIEQIQTFRDVNHPSLQLIM